MYGTNNVTITTTLLNIAAVFSHINQHEKALNHAKIALKILNSIPQNPELRNSRYYANLAIAHHNIAAEQEHMRKITDTTLSNYTKSIKIANEKLGPKNLLSQNITRNYINARKSLCLSSTVINMKKRSSCASDSQFLKQNLSQKSLIRNESNYWDQQFIKENTYNQYYLNFKRLMKKNYNNRNANKSLNSTGLPKDLSISIIKSKNTKMQDKNKRNSVSKSMEATKILNIKRHNSVAHTRKNLGKNDFNNEIKTRNRYVKSMKITPNRSKKIITKIFLLS